MTDHHPAVGTPTDQLLATAKRALHEMCHTVAPRDTFTDAVDALDAAIAAMEAPAPDPVRGTPQPDLMADAAEMLWVVLANVSGGDWTQQSAEWQEAAARWRDNYFQALKQSKALVSGRQEEPTT